MMSSFVYFVTVSRHILSRAHISLTLYLRSGSTSGLGLLIADGIVNGEDALPGLFFYYFFGVFGYAAGHTLPVEEGLSPDTGQFGYAGHELDPLPIGKGVKKCVELCGLNMLYIVVRHRELFIEVVLFCTLQQTQVCGAIFYFARSFVGSNLMLCLPTVNICPAKH